MDLRNGDGSLLQIDKCDACKFPTKTHETFINYITHECNRRSVTALLKGSLAKGTAKKHSDVDIILMGGRIQDCFDDIVGAFDKILLSECFTATSTYMIVYMNGLAVEYDIRRSVTKEDIKKSRILNIEDCRLSDICRDRVHIDSQLCPVRSSEYSKLMIAQMCYAKLLCQKDKLAREIYYDRIRLLSNTGVDNGLNLSEISMESQVQFINRLKHLVQTSTECSVEIEKYLDSLLLDIQRHIARENSNT